jgi:predicted transposase YdaD
MDSYFESFDASLKYLAERHPQDFVRFASDDPEAEVLRPVLGSLPSRGRDIDSSFVARLRGQEMVVHFEFHRRHQGSDELAEDVAEAQIRLYRREKLKVLSVVWDLYGNRNRPVLEERVLVFGTNIGEHSSLCAFRVVNLRGLSSRELLTEAPPALWPLVALTSDGADEAQVRLAADAIDRRQDLSSAERDDHLAVLWFVAGAEGVPLKVLWAILSQERIMESEMYREVFSKWLDQGRAEGEIKGEIKGEARGEARTQAETIVHILTHRLGKVDAKVRDHVRNLTDNETRQIWYHEALLATTADEARRLAEKIRLTID